MSRRSSVEPFVMVASDGSALAPYGRLGSIPSPIRATTGVSQRCSRTLFRDRKLVTLEEAVKKMTHLRLPVSAEDRGLLQPGYRADITVFDPARVADGRGNAHGWFDSQADKNGFFVIAPDAGKNCFDSSATRGGDRDAIVRWCST